MKKKVSTFLMCTVALLTMSLIPIVYATSPEPASGKWTYVVHLIEITKTANGNIFKYGEETGTWTGTFEGTSSDYFELVVHPKGFVTCQGRIDFEGTVNGESGTMIILFVGKKNLAAGLWSGKWVIIGGTGGLANLQGRGTWNGPSFNLDYSGMIHFKPNQ